MIRLRLLPGTYWLTVTILCGLAGCAPTGIAPSTQPIATVQPNDRHMSCNDLQSEIASMDAIINAPVDTGTNTALASMGTTALGFIPVVGSIATLALSTGSAASGMAGAENIQAQVNRQSQAQQRKARLMQLYDNKGC